MAQAKSTARGKSKFQSPEPISSRPEERIAARTEQRRAAAAAARPRMFGLGRPSPLLIAILFFATVGFLIAAYTTYEHYTGLKSLACLGGKVGSHSSCITVQSSEWNNVAGIPVAVLGLVGYFVIFASLTVRNDLGRAVAFGTALIGFLFSAYLTYREAFSIHAYCEWCLGSAVCMTILMILTGIRFLRTPPDVV